MQVFLNAFIQSMREEIKNITELYFGKHLLNERGRLNPSSFLAYSQLDKKLPFEDSQPQLHDFKQIPELEINHEKIGRMVFEFYRLKCYSSIVLLNRNYSCVKVLAYQINGIQPFEVIQIHLFFNGKGQVTRLKTIVKKGFDREMAQYARLHFTTEYLEKKFEFCLKKEVT